MKRSLLYFFLLTVLCSAFAMPEIHKLPQPAQHAKPEPEERIILKHADNLRFNENEMQSAQRLSGNVVLMHKGMTMFCDSAMLYEQSQTFDAFGHVKIVQGDTLTLTGDRLHYDGETLIAEMRFNVIMTHRNQKLYTDSLYYDRLYNMGYYEEGGKLIDGKNQLTSDWGEYHTDTRQATFNYNVELINDRFKLITDTLHYDTQTKWAEVVGASNIYSNADTLYTEHGFYNSDNEQVKLYKRSKAYGRNRIMEGDTVYYDKKTGVMEAFQNVSCLDEKNKNLLTGDYAWYNELTGEAIATKNALARDFSQGKDTLYFHADTLHMYSYNLETDSAYRVLHAYFHARAYREDVQAVADSMVFHSAQKKITLFRDPIAWSDQRQIVGEEINVYLNDSTIDSVYVDRQALMIEKLDSTHFNQVGAQQMRTYFVKGEVSENRAVGNVMVVNYPLEKDSTIIYQNYVETAEARMFMKDRKLKKYGLRHRMASSTPSVWRLPNVPDSRICLVRLHTPHFARRCVQWRGKKAGTALKPSIRREAPLQNL